ncbi:hypothetical protein GCM10007047_33610 [Cerasicoccus arenae]|uniref:PA14 domain-containing protein n=2 Tax=Cerasicoccus arenae TaxID=424488 RepID=A0A8J3DF06_9BACT|nr:hypothetical protein [Cerasicoccus arenae]GHC13530.1 hypothetical protein GCM10007047_33610 [Cerasicoccus arenae]
MAITALGQTILPYETDFESSEGFSVGAFSGDSDWSVESGASEISDLDSASAQQSLLFPAEGGNHALSMNFTGQSGQVVFVDFYLKPQAGELVDLPLGPYTGSSAQTGFIRVNGEGEVIAMDGDGLGYGDWVTTSERYGLVDDVSADWHRFTYRLNYFTKSWDLYLDGQMVLADLGFLDANLLAFTTFRLSSDGAADLWFDFFYAGESNPLFVDQDLDGIPDSYEIAQGMSVSMDDRYGDLDHDLLANLEEFLSGTSAGNPDTDGDGVADGMEMIQGGDPVIAEAYSLSNAPFYDGFEAYDVGPFQEANNWNAGETTTLRISDSDSAEGGQSLVLVSPGQSVSLRNPFTTQSYSTVWVDFHLKASSFAEAPEVSAESAVAYCFNNDGQLMVYDGVGNGGGIWLTLDRDPVELGEWQRLTTRIDYQSQHWSLWLNGVLVRENLGFANSSPFFSQLRIDSASSRTSAALDAVSVAYSEPLGLDDDGDGLPNAFEDSNGNGLVDAGETNPRLVDTDGDGIDDLQVYLGNYQPAQQEYFTNLFSGQAAGWSTDFETPEGYELGVIDGQHYWIASPGARVDEGGFSSPQTLALDGAGQLEGHDVQARHYFDGTGMDRFWVSFRAKLVPARLVDPSELDESSSVLFALSGNERLSAYDVAASKWQISEILVDSSQWHRYDVYLDYTAKTWKVCVDGVLAFDSLPFLDPNRATFERFRAIQQAGSEAPAYIDQIVMSAEEPSDLDYDGDGLDNATETELGTEILTADSDGDGLPDGWEVVYGFNPLYAGDATSNADGDILRALDEYLLGTDPTVPDSDLDGVRDGEGQVGKILREVWNEIANREVVHLLNDSRYPHSPDERQWFSSLVLSPNYGDHYGDRFRGFITPAESGSYTFYLMGDDHAELWLSTSDSKFDRQLIANVPGATGYLKWNKFPEQQSVEIPLEAGVAYYIEILHKENAGNDYVGAAWQLADGPIQVIKGDFLTSWIRDNNDLDDDNLPDDWEIANGLDPQDNGQTNALEGARGDFDQDGLSNSVEWGMALNPTSADTDSDGLADWDEVNMFDLDPTTPNLDAPFLPVSDWTISSIGDVRSGAAYLGTDGHYFIRGSGSGALGLSDELNFFHKSLRGDFSLTMRIHQIHNEDGNHGFVGLMGRESTNANARYGATLAPVGTYFYNSVRSTIGLLPSEIRQYWDKKTYPNVWIKLVRHDRIFESYLSNDSENWYFVGAQVAVMSEDLEVGLTLFSESNASIYAEVELTELIIDQDQDGLYDDDELQLYGTLIDNPDSDGDGVSDYDEIFHTLTNPLVAEFTGEFNSIANVQGAELTPARGDWLVQGSSLISEGLNGDLAYLITLDEDGFYRLKLEGKNLASTPWTWAFDLEVLVDGLSVGRGLMTRELNSVGEIYFYLPYLKAGEHVVTVSWHNAKTGVALEFMSLQVDQPLGIDGDANGVADWEQTRSYTLSSFDDDLITTYVSPVCLEGQSRYPTWVSISTDLMSEPIIAQQGLAGRWFQDVELDPGAITTISVSDAGAAKTYQKDVEWLPLNLLVAEDMTIRQSDSMLLSAFLNNSTGNHPVTIDVVMGSETVAHYDITSSELAMHVFDVPGDYSITVQYQHGNGNGNGNNGNGNEITSNEIQVNVLATDLGLRVVGYLNRTRAWNPSVSNDQIVFESDDSIRLQEDETNDLHFLITPLVIGHARILARINEDGPVLDVVSVETVDVALFPNTSYRVAEIFDDGSQLIEYGFVLDPLPEDIVMVMEIQVGGALFIDGSTTMVLTADDFDEYGQVKVLFLVPSGSNPATCHTFELFQNGVSLGHY